VPLEVGIAAGFMWRAQLVRCCGISEDLFSVASITAQTESSLTGASGPYFPLRALRTGIRQEMIGLQRNRRAGSRSRPTNNSRGFADNYPHLAHT
jgi:hypothetical protein